MPGRPMMPTGKAKKSTETKVRMEAAMYPSKEVG